MQTLNIKPAKTDGRDTQAYIPPEPELWPEGTESYAILDSEYQEPWVARTLKDAYQERPPTQFAAGKLFAFPSVNIVYSSPGDLKSLLMGDCGICVSSNLPWLPEAPWLPGAIAFQTTQCPVIWIDFDNGTDLTDERFAALARARNLPDDIPFFYYSMPSPGLNADDDVSIQALKHRIQQHHAKVIFIDNLGTVSGDADENSAEMGGVMYRFRRLAEETNAAIVIIHHQRKGNGLSSRQGDSLRGHSSIEAAIDLALIIEREEYSDDVTIKCTKSRRGSIFPFGATFTYENDEYGRLTKAMFYGLKVEDNYSDAAIETAIKESLFGTKLNQSKLLVAVKEIMPEAPQKRTIKTIKRMAATQKLKVSPGDRGAILYALP